MTIKVIVKRILFYIKLPYYRLYHISVHPSSYLRDASDIRFSTIGKYCWINHYVGINHVVMGNYCSIASHVTIGAMEHPIEQVSTSARLFKDVKPDKMTYIGNDVWIGSQCVIRQGVTIGDGAVIGANSFVNKDVPPYAIVVGSPAKILRYRFSANKIQEIVNTKYWDENPIEAKNKINLIK